MTGIRESSGGDASPTASAVVHAGASAAAGSGGQTLGRSSWWRRRMPGRPRALTVVAVLGVLLFALWGIGGPVFGTSTLSPTDELVTNGPWVNTGFAGTVPSNTFLDDTYTSQLPSEILFKQQLGHGEIAQWNPYGAAGSALGAVPNYAFFSPLTVPFYVLPTWLAPAYERLLEVVCSVGGAFLFLRRVKLSRPSALVGGVVFAGSGFMVAWLGFPQTRVAAFIPALFWVVERFVQERRLRDAALVAVPVAALLLGGFPSVAGYSLVSGTIYALVRLVGEHRDELRRLVRPVLCLAGGLLAGVGLALFQLVPFLAFFHTWLIDGRNQTSSSTLPLVSAMTMLTPWAYGTVDARNPVQFVLDTNLVEAVAYIGAAAAVLVLVALALPRRGRALMPTGVWVFFVAASALWLQLIYGGGPLLGLLQKMPGSRSLFEQNFIGRARSVVGFLLAVLVAVGFELLIRTREHEAVSRRRQLWGLAVIAGSLGFGVHLFFDGRNAARNQAAATGQSTGKIDNHYLGQLAIAGAIIVIAVSCVIALRVAGRRNVSGRAEAAVLRFSAATTLIVLVAVQGAQFMQGYYPKADRKTFFPVTDTHAFLAGNLGHERYASSYDGIEFGTNTAYDLRSVNGHTFLNAEFAALLKGMPDNAVPYPTYVDFQAGDAKQATSPVLDLLGTKYWVAGPLDALFGTVRAAPHTGTTQLVPGKPVTVPLTGPVRGIGLTPEGTVPPDLATLTVGTTIDVVVRDAAGRQVAATSRLTDAKAGAPLQVAVAADAVPAGTPLTATVTLHAAEPLTIAADDGAPAIDTIGDAADGLRLVYSGSSVIYQRLNALPRIRWASQSTVVPVESRRVAMLASGAVPADTVVLSDPGPAASGRPATVQVTGDGTDSITAAVDAKGSGYLVVADALQVGWQASVDGRHADLVKADQGVVAVNVPAGKHTVTVRYDLPRQTVATWMSGLVAVSLLAVSGGEVWWERRRRPLADSVS